MIEFLLGVLILVLLLVLQASQRPKNFPRGPRRLPLVGCLPYLKRKDPTYIYKAFVKLSKEYGPVVGLYFGPFQPFVSVCGYEAVKEALYNEDLNGRANSSVDKMRSYGQRLGFILNEGEEWQVQRRFALRHLRDLGFGKTWAEDMIHEEIHDLMEDIETQRVKNPIKGSVNFKGFFSISLVNVIWAFIAGQRFERSDERLLKLLDYTNRLVGSVSVIRGGIPTFILKWLPVVRSRFKLMESLKSFIRESIDQHEESRVDGAPRDFIDAYLEEIEKGSPSFHKQQLTMAIMDLFMAGSETTSHSIGFVLLHLIHHPEIQRKVQAELDQVCVDDLPHLADRPNLPYTEAVLMEVQRCSTITPLAIPHRATKDTTLGGYSIPEGSRILLNLYSIHMDETKWAPDPEIFRPERHLNAEGTQVIKSDYIIPFGAGKRMCLGESLARNTYFLFTTALLKSYEFSVIPSEPLPSLLPKFGLTNAYQGFTAVLTPR